MILNLTFGLSGAANAKKFYKYVDDKGITHYSDKAPKTEQPVESWQVRVEDTKFEVKVVNQGSRKEPQLYAVNPYYGPVEVYMTIVEATNLLAEPDLPRSVVVPANSKKHISSLFPLDESKSWSYGYQVEFALGDPAAAPDDYAYHLPFIKGPETYISQSFNGPQTHSADAANKYAVDIAMPEGSPILAARAGVVMEIARDFYSGGTSDKYKSRSNFVRIAHADGTMAIYAHLLLESIIVRPGQRVNAGQKIALSGSTGFSSGPHLHYAVQKNNNRQLESIPFQFKLASGTRFTPEVGQIPNN